jgi:opacity protein-like surface antigen
MKRIIASVLAVSAIAAAAPAFAQPRPYGDRDRDGVPNAYDGRNDNRGGYRGYGQWQGVGGRINAIERRIDVGIRNGQITRNEAYRLRSELRNVSYLETRYRRSSGLSNWERRDLDQRLDRLAQRVRMERRDMDRYGFGRRY